MGIKSAWKELFKGSNSTVKSHYGGSRSILPTSNYIINSAPSWRKLGTNEYLLDCYETNPVVQAVINIKAEAFANMKFFVKMLKDGEMIPLEQYTIDGGDLKKLLGSPNPLQSTYEWLRQFKINYEVFGNAYQYVSTPIGYNNFHYRDINVLNNLYSDRVCPVLSGKWLDMTTKDEIVTSYKFRNLDGSYRDLSTSKVFHLNNSNIRFDCSFTEGISDLVALRDPISNIYNAYEARNVLIKNRGALGILTSDVKDEGMGSVSLTPDETEEVQDAYRQYGLMEDQYSLLISPHPLKYQKMSSETKSLMLFEEIEADAIAIANAKGVPELLAKYYIKGGTFENLNASEKRLYDSTIIPEAKDFLRAFNVFLKLEDEGIELCGSYDHVNVLQANKKEEAETQKLRFETARGAFASGLTTYGQFAIDANIELLDASMDGLRVWNLSKDQLNAIGLKNETGNNKETGE